MKKNIIVIGFCLLTCAGSIIYAPRVEANGWANAGKILAGVAGVDLLFNGGNSMVGRTVGGVGHVFTGGPYYSQPAPCVYTYAQPAPRRCWDEVRRIPAYDSYGYFLGYFDRRVTVCTEY